MTVIDRHITIEELVGRYPGSVKFLINRGLPCLVCGEPTWGTLEELAKDKGWTDTAIDELVEAMNESLVEGKAA
jgi:methionine synthase II (cobalamin-independent)